MLIIRLVQYSLDPNFLWRRAQAAFVLALREEAEGRQDTTKSLYYEAFDNASKALKIDSNNSNVHKWSVEFLKIIMN